MEKSPMVEIYTQIEKLDKKIQETHERLLHSISIAIECLDCGEDAERENPDTVGALEMLMDARRELKG